MRVAVLQMAARPGDVAGNLAAIAAAAREEAARGTALLVAPELALPGYGAGEDLRTLAEPADGPSVAALGRIARETGVAIVAGFAERAGPRLHNTAVLTDGRRPPVFHRKRDLFGGYERALFTPGPGEPVLAEVAGHRLGLLVCYEVEFPERVRALARAGAGTVVVPTALPAGPWSAFVAQSLVAVRAFENQVFLAYADLAGSDGRFSYAGLSSIRAPDGGALAAAGPGPARIAAPLDPAAFAPSRAANTYLADLDPALGRAD